MQVSIEGREKVHNNLRGDPHSFERAILAVTNLRKEGVDVAISPTFRKENANEIKYLYELAKKLGCDLSIKRSIPTGRVRGESLSPKEYKHLYDFAFQMNKQDKDTKIFIHCDPLRVIYEDKSKLDLQKLSGCLAGFGVLYICFNGDIYPCSKFHLKLGNIYQDRVRKILKSPIVARLKDRNNLRGKCGKCELRWVCGGCRADAFSNSGDIFGEDPLCWYQSTHSTT